jgi:ribonuclease HI
MDLLMVTHIKLFFDGACNNKLEAPNMGIGIAVFINNNYHEEFSNPIFACSTEEERGTSNIAEWRGCMEAMRKANKLKRKFPDAVFEVFSDSQVITYQFNGDYIIKKPEFIKYHNQAWLFAEKVGIKKITWIPREQNKIADKLSKRGLQLTEA